MSGVRIVTDSSSDLTEDDLDQLDVRIVPLSIRFGDQEFTDGLDLTVADFYSRMARSTSYHRHRAQRPEPSSGPSQMQAKPELTR